MVQKLDLNDFEVFLMVTVLSLSKISDLSDIKYSSWNCSDSFIMTLVSWGKKGCGKMVKLPIFLSKN